MSSNVPVSPENLVKSRAGTTSVSPNKFQAETTITTLRISKTVKMPLAYRFSRIPAEATSLVDFAIVDANTVGNEDDPDQAYFWTPEWQAGEREADEDIAAGRVVKFDTMEDLIADLMDEDE